MFENFDLGEFLGDAFSGYSQYIRDERAAEMTVAQQQAEIEQARAAAAQAAASQANAAAQQKTIVMVIVGAIALLAVAIIFRKG